MLSISTAFLSLIGVTLSLDALITFNCDNQFWAKVSTDDGATFTEVSQGNDWPTPDTVTISGVTADTIFDLECKDNGVVGGFIAEVSFGGQTYYTTNPITAGEWTLESASDNDYSLVYNTYPAWNTHVTVKPGQSWIWNGNVHNTLVFRFDFGDGIIGTSCDNNNDCEGGLICCSGAKVCHPPTWTPAQAQNLAQSAHTGVQPQDYINNINHGKDIKDNHWYYTIIMVGVILFVLINNIFIGYWCVCKGGSAKVYNNVKVEYNED